MSTFFNDDRRMAELAVRKIAQREARGTNEKDDQGEKKPPFIKNDPVF
jgi:hypothetical protein